MKKNKKIAIGLCILLLGMSAVLSGCIDSVTTVGWSNSERYKQGAILKGAAPKEHNGFPIVEEKIMFVIDTESHEDWTEYEIIVDGDDIINKRSIAGNLYFEGEIPELDLYEPYYFRAVALYVVHDGTEEMWVAGEEISFSMLQSPEGSIIE